MNAVDGITRLRMRLLAAIKKMPPTRSNAIAPKCAR